MSEEATVSAPKSFSFEDVNHWVHIDSPEYEELQWNSLGMAQHIDGLQGRLAKLDISEEEMRREFERQSIEHSLYAGIELEFDHKRDCYKEARVHYGWQMFRAAVKLMQERCK